MPRIHQSLPACLACALLAGSPIFAQAPAEKPTTPPAAEATPRTPAEQLLDAAIAKTDSLSSLDTTFTHTILTRGTKAKSHGRLLLAPGRKALYEFHVQVVDGKGRLKIFCDGETIYRVRQIGDEMSVAKYELEQFDKAREELREPGALDAALAQELVEDLMSEHGFTSITSLLRDLRKRMTFARHEPSVLNRADGQSAPVYIVEGEWSKESLKKLAPPKQSADPNAPDLQKYWEERRPEYLMVPRKCRLYLSRDGSWPWTDSLWPVRMEWLGMAKVGGADEVLIAIDFTLPTRQVPADSQFELTTEEKKLKAETFDVVGFTKARKNARQRAQASQDTPPIAPGSPLRPPAIPPGKP